MIDKLQIEILENGYNINGKTFFYPVNINDLKQFLGNGRLYEEERLDVDNRPFNYSIVIWDKLGISAVLEDLVNKDKDIAWRLIVKMRESDRDQKINHPEQIFAGCINVQGKELKNLKCKRDDDWFGEYILGESVIYIDFNEEEIDEVEIRSQRKRAEGKHNINVNVQETAICINGELFSYPLDLAKIRKCIAIYPDEICEKDNEFDNGFSFGINDKGKMKVSIDLYYFDGQFTVNGKECNKAKKKKDKYGYSAVGIYGDSKVYYSLKHSDGSIKYMEITQFDSMLIDKYKIKETNEEIITFKDLNFKLLVIDELMYEKELLKPKFNIYEFAEQYQQGNIDTASDEPIKEVLNYFSKYPIEKRFAAEITELMQDGNEIYMNIAPQWDGEDSAFDIKSAQDAQQLPNLKKVTITSDNFNKLSKQFKVLGIEAELL